MLKIENVITPSPEQWRAVIMGARNPLNSWNRSDSHFDCTDLYEYCDLCPHYESREGGGMSCEYEINGHFMEIGPNDRDLMMRLRNAGTDHRKFMRMIVVYADLTAPLYWWKEFDTYKVGTVANSCSTMHKIADKKLGLEDFSHEHLIPRTKEVLIRTIDELNYWKFISEWWDNLPVYEFFWYGSCPKG